MSYGGTTPTPHVVTYGGGFFAIMGGRGCQNYIQN